MLTLFLVVPVQSVVCGDLLVTESAQPLARVRYGLLADSRRECIFFVHVHVISQQIIVLDILVEILAFLEAHTCSHRLGHIIRLRPGLFCRAL